MRKILIVGAGQSGLQLALGLQSNGYDVTADVRPHGGRDPRRPGDVDAVHVPHRAAARARPRAELVGGRGAGSRASASRCAGAGRPAARIDWVGRLDGYAQSVDQRVKMAGWLELFAQRGGQLVIHGVAVSDLDSLRRTLRPGARLGGQGRAGLDVRPGRRPARRTTRRSARSRSPTCTAWARGPSTRTSQAVRCNLVPGVGELFVIPRYTIIGRLRHPLLGGHPRRPAGRLPRPVKDPAEHLRPHPGPDEDRSRPGSTSAATQGRADRRERHPGRRLRPVVRNPVGELPGGGLVLGVADVVVANDPITGQGSNNAAKCAASYLGRILAHGDQPFDREWMQADVRPLLGLRRSTSPSGPTRCWRRRPSTSSNLIGAAGATPAGRPTGSPTASTTRPTSSTGSIDPEKTDAYLASVRAGA